MLPTASGSFGDKPVITFPDAPAPADLGVEPLVLGEGDVVEAGDEIEVNYLGQVWGGQVFDNSYDRGAPVRFPIGVGAVIQGWDEALVGASVGSRVLISIPPDLGYGPAGMPRAGIGGTDTLVFVVDVLGTRRR